MTAHLSQTPADNAHRFSWFDRGLMAPALPHYEVLASCPKGDVALLRMLGLLQWFSALWTCVLLANAGRIMFSHGEWEAYDVLLAILVSGILLIADATIFIASSHFAHGIAELERTGEFKLENVRSAKVRSGVLIGSRFAMALVTANFLAVIAGLLGFDTDLRKVLEADYRQANAALFIRTADRFDTELSKIGLRIKDVGSQIAEGEKEERSLRRTIVEPTADEPELRVAIERVGRAEAAKADAERARIDAEIESADEVGGKCGPRRSCKPGRGPKWRAAQERIAATERAAREADRTLVQVQAVLRQLQEARGSEMRRKVEDAKARLGEVTTNKQAQEAQLAGLNKDYQTRLANREGLIRQAVERSPDHVAQDDGLVARLRALRKLMEQPSVAAVIWLIEAFLIFLEMAAVIGASISLVPMEYATKIAERDLRRAYETARRLKAFTGSGNSPQQPTPEQAGTPSIVPPKPQPASPAAPPPVPPSRGPRHAPRWRPPSGSSGTAIPPEDGPPAPSNPNGKSPPSAPPT